jgi:hypothetical protein
MLKITIISSKKKKKKKKLNLNFADRNQFEYSNLSSTISPYTHGNSEKLFAMQDEFVCYSTLHGQQYVIYHFIANSD